MDQFNLTTATRLLISHYHDSLDRAETLKVEQWVAMKIRHTYAVLHCAQGILATSSELAGISDHTRRRCELAALLHDIGRFHQHDGQRMFNHLEFEHGYEGYKILVDVGYTDPAILLAVKYHNKISLDGLSEEPEYIEATSEERECILIACRIVRDADKLQNLEYYVFDNGKYYHTLFAEGKGSIHPEALRQYMSGQLVAHEYTKTPIDSVLGMASWLHDIHYSGTRQSLRTVGFVDFIAKELFFFGVDAGTVHAVTDTLSAYRSTASTL